MMSSKDLLEALRSKKFYCPECGGKMFFEDPETEDILICSDCGYDMHVDEYGYDSREEYEDSFINLSWDYDPDSEDNEDDD